MTARTERILIIDPDDDARADLDRYLVSRGFYAVSYALCCFYAVSCGFYVVLGGFYVVSCGFYVF